MENTLANPERTQKPSRTPWRVAALLAAGAVALAACGGAAASGAGSTPTPTTVYSAVPSAPAAPTPGGTAAADPAATDIGIVNFEFSPATLTVKVGTTVVWTNKDAIGHTVNFNSGGIDSNVLNHNDQFTYTFTTPGTYDYICSIHPFMHGSVTVTN